VEARKFAVRVRKRYWRSSSPDSAASLGIRLESTPSSANLIADDWIESNNLREDSHAFLNIGEP